MKHLIFFYLSEFGFFNNIFQRYNSENNLLKFRANYPHYSIILNHNFFSKNPTMFISDNNSNCFLFNIEND